MDQVRRLHALQSAIAPTRASRLLATVLAHSSFLFAAPTVAQTVIFDQATDSTFAGVLSGDGGLIKLGAGTLKLTGTNTYSGGTTLNAGKLAISSDSNLGNASGRLSFGGGTLRMDAALASNRNVTLNAGGGTFDTQVFDAHFAGVIDGAGGLTKTGAGSLALSGTNGYSGGTTLREGTLSIAADANLGASNSSLTFDGGTLHSLLGISTARDITLAARGGTIRNGASVTDTISGDIDGTGTLTKTGAGTLVLTGTNTYSGGTLVSAGTVRGDSNSLQGNIVTANRTNVVFQQNTDGVYAGNMTGSGNLTKQGTGTLRVTGTLDQSSLTNSERGTLFLRTGTLDLDGGSILNSNAIQIGSGGTGTLRVAGSSSRVERSGAITLGGSGGTGRLLIENGGTIAATSGVVGGGGGSTGEMVVDGSGSTWTSTGELIVGNIGNGMLSIVNGGQVNSGGGALGKGASGEVLISGAGSRWTSTSDITTGNPSDTRNPAGTITVADGGTLASTNINLASGRGTGTLNIGSGGAAGILNVDAVRGIGANRSFLNLNHTDAAYTLNARLLDELRVNHIGSGTTILTGENTYRGGTNLQASTLAISRDTNLGDGSSQLSIGGGTLRTDAALTSSRNVMLNAGGGTLNTNGFDSLFSGVIDGAGGLTKTGAGTLTMSGTNTFSGGTTVRAGTVSIAADSNLGGGALALDGGTLQLSNDIVSARAVTLGAGGGAIETNTAGSVFSGVISGDGSLTKTGTGTLTLSGTNTFAGGTTLRDGTLAISTDDNLGSASGRLTFSGGTLQFLGGVSTARNVTLDAGGGTIQHDSSTVTLSGAIDGLGTLTKTGTGTLLLTGANSYSGGTIVSTGRVQGDSTSLQGDIVSASGTTVEFDQNSNGTYAGDMSGAGALIKQGAGTLTLSGSNSYSGGTTISGGTLQGNSASLQGNIVNDAAAVFDQATNGTYSGTMSGSGSLTKLGAGTLTLNGMNSYRSGTRLEAGTLSISADHNLGAAASGLMFDGGTLQTTSTFTATRAATLENGGGGFDVADGSTLTYEGTVTGSGELRKLGAGTLILNGDNTYSGGTSVLAGTLRGDTTSIRGNVRNDATLAFDQQTDGTFYNEISGTGSLRKLGTAELTLRGANTYSGPTFVERGLLSVDGSLMSAVTVSDNAALGGIGVIHNSVTVERGATLTPGNSVSPINTLTIAGPLTLLPGSRLVIDTDAAGNSDHVRVTGTNGTATIGGSTLRMEAIGNRYQRNTTYTVLTADAGVSGTFAAVSSDLAFLTPSLSYETNTVRVTLTRNDLQFSDIARGENERAVAEYLDGVLGVDELIRGFDSLNVSQARNAFGTLSGEGLSSLPRAAAANTARAHEVISTRLAIGAEDDVEFAPRSRAKARGEIEEPKAGGWARAIGASGEMADGKEASGYNWDTVGTAAGFERRFGSQQVLGASVMHTRSNVSFGADRRATGEITTPQALVYSSYSFADAPDRRRRQSKHVQLRGILGYARHAYETERPVDIGLVSTQARGSHDAQEWSAQGEVEFVNNIGEFRLQTLFGLRYIRQQVDGYTETGGLGALDVQEATLESVAVTAGGRIVRPVFNDRGLIEMRAQWSRELNDTDPTLTASVAGASNDARFSVAGVPIFPDTFTLGASISGRVHERVFVHADYRAELWRSGRDQQSIIAGFSYVW